MRTLLKVGFSLLILAIALIAVTASMLRAHGVSNPSNPAGRMVMTETRSVNKAIKMLDLNGPFDLIMRQGATPSLTISGEQRLLSNVVTSIDGGTLHIGTQGLMFQRRRPIQVELVLPTIEQLTIRGSGDSKINGFSGDKLQVEMHGSGSAICNGRFRNIDAGVFGSGELELNGGNSDKVAVQMMGSGQLTVVGSTKALKSDQTGTGALDAQHLAADSVSVDMTGSGSSTVTARQDVTLNLHGSGDVVVYGNPSRRTVTRTGSGEVSFNQ